MCADAHVPVLAVKVGAPLQPLLRWEASACTQWLSALRVLVM